MGFFNLNSGQSVISALFLTVLVVDRAISAELSCDEQLIQSDKCLKKLLFIGDWNLTFVQSESDMVEHCKMVKDQMNCIKKYKHCLHGLPRELFNMVAQHAREILQERCGSAKGRHVFLKHIRCLDDENTKISKCMDKVIILLNFIAEEVDGSHENLLTASCCAGHYLLDCFMSRISQACKHLEGHDSGPYIVEKINSMVAGTFDIACSKYPSLAQCDKDHSELMKNFREKLTPEDKIERQSMSPLIPLIKIAKKLKF
ncbi:uncharacterized protein LOC141856193 [Brevipalpus obovatus]|uniref:uncharacterized protein LOC141856193 n=1 Tax=Brevipalpus obovatus TaxID=246614 RepID=UPI003D9EB6CE